MVKLFFVLTKFGQNNVKNLNLNSGKFLMLMINLLNGPEIMLKLLRGLIVNAECLEWV